MKNCLTCKYFSKYYIKSYQKFKPTDNGFCCNLNVKPRKRPKDNDCKYWEQTPDNKEDCEKIEKEIRKMSKRLNEIALYLKNED